MIRPTFAHPKAGEYARPGGPWDVPDLDRLLSAGSVEVVDGARRLAGAAVDLAVSGVAAALAEAGVAAGDVVSWQLPNQLEAWLLYRACWRLGAVAAPMHHGAGVADVEAALGQVDPSVVVAGAGLAAAAWPGSQPAEWIEAAAGARAEPGSFEGEARDPASVAVVLFTSGSTGSPKGVVHTHRGLAAKARTMASVHGLGPDDAVLMPAPLAHISGLLNGLLVPGVAGMKTVLMCKWDPSSALDLVESERVTFMIGPPTFFVSLMGAPGFSAARVAPLRLVSSGGAGVTPAFVDAATDALDCHVKRTYGSTEAPTVTTSGPGDPPERARSTDGRATGEAEVAIVSPESGTPVDAGVAGEVWIRGPEVCEGYLDAGATAAAFTADGWFRTGDLGVVDADGWLTITGRLKDVIIRGGENISAVELENVLESHPAVSHAAIVGYPDERLGQRVCAFVVAAEHFDLERCRAWMAERGVTRFKWPERVVQVDSLPTLAAGKVDRRALERIAAGD